MECIIGSVIGMLDTLSKEQIVLLWGNFRNLIDFTQLNLISEIMLKGTQPGEFPVDAYLPIYLEIPKTLEKSDISSRSYTYSETDWSQYRIINVPAFDWEENNVKNISKSFFDTINNWNNSLIPEEIPCIVIAIKERGNYCDEREAQFISVLVIWSNYVARILNLEWFEGPVEDCISPEWYITTSNLLSIENSLKRFRNIKKHFPKWSNPNFSVLCNPNFLVKELMKGEECKSPYRNWSIERLYLNQSDFQIDVENLCQLLEGNFILT